MAGAVEVSGTLQLCVDDRSIDVTAYGSRVRVEIGDLVRPRASLRFVRSTSTLARRLSGALDARTLTLVVTRHGEPIAELGAGVRGGPIARLFGFGRVRFLRKSSRR